MKEVSIIFPALNEEETIGKIIDEVPIEEIEGRGYRAEIIVVDNGSTDKTREIAEAKGARVITEPNRGKGRAMRTAFEAVSGDFVFMIDADFTYPATYVPRMLELLEGGYDVVLGSRLKGQREEGAMSRLNMVGNHLLALLANVLYGTGVSDPCTGYWGFRGEVPKSLKLDAVGFELEANMLAEIARQGYRIAELPILYRRRPNQAKLGSLKDGFKIGLTLIRKRFR
ncbi:Undecaprenyl-phosphate 4-deoxy-4-formamido-L-arabinose transferase [subsurface metagenome]